MDINKFNELMRSLKPSMIQATLQQEHSEWQAFLEFAWAYFHNRNITNPIIVEIGVYHNFQRDFYKNLLNAEHIGIDIRHYPGVIAPDILGDSHAETTIARLKECLHGRMIDLLFIDGAHSYDAVKRDYDLYSPLTGHLVALHDIYTAKLNPRDSIGVIDFWLELIRQNKCDTLIEFRHHNPESGRGVFNPGRQMGIGLIIKEST